MFNIQELKIHGLDTIFKEIEDITIDVKPNEHGYAEIKGILDENGRSMLTKITNDTVVSIASKNGTVIFEGLVQSMKENVEYATTYLSVQLVTCSTVLDKKKKSRTFQDLGMQYAEIIKKVLEDYPKYSVVCHSEVQKPTGKCVLQYEETDFEFVKRLASECQTSIFPGNHPSKCVLEVGIPEQQNTSTWSGKFKKGISQQYQKAGAESAGLSMTEFMYYKVVSDDLLQIGDMIAVDGKSMKVMETHAFMEKAVLRFEYLVGLDKYTFQNTVVNQKATGLALRGIAGTVNANTLQVDFTIDSANPVKVHADIPWQTLSSNLLYAMPESDTQVLSYWDAESDGKFTAFTNIRQNGETCANTQNPEVKVFMYPGPNKIEVAPAQMNVTFSNSNMTLTNGNSVSFYTDQNTKVESSDKVGVNANDMFFISPYTLAFASHNGMSFFNLTNTIDGEGQNVYENMKIEAEFPMILDEPEEVPMELNWAKLIVKAVIVATIVALVTVAAVVTFGAALGAGAVVATMLITTAAVGAFAAGSAIYHAKKDGYGWDRALYDGANQFCNYALVAACTTFASFAGQGPVVATMIGSFGYNSIDAILDERFGYDYFDQYQYFNPVPYLQNIAIDTVVSILACGLDKILSKGLSKVFPKVNTSSREAMRKWLGRNGIMSSKAARSLSNSELIKLVTQNNFANRASYQVLYIILNSGMGQGVSDVVVDAKGTYESIDDYSDDAEFYFNDSGCLVY